MLRRTTPDPDDPRPLTPLLIPTADPARHPPLGLDLGRDTCVPAATTLTANALIIATVRTAPTPDERRDAHGGASGTKAGSPTAPRAASQAQEEVIPGDARNAYQSRKA